MIKLPNGCTCSELSVSPKNWQSKNASINMDWYIMYRFYDPKYPKPKQVMIKGMNRFKSLLERQQETIKSLTEQIDKLVKEEFNPFNKKKVKNAIVSNIDNAANQIDLNPETPILDALLSANETVEVASCTRRDLKFALAQITKATVSLGFKDHPISKVSRKTIKLILDEASNSSDRFNKNRSYLMILFSELCELEIIDVNPLWDIKKKKVVKHIRKVLSDDERVLVNNHLKNNYPEFHRFLHIFYHSGARISELLRIKKTDVELPKQRYKVVIKKGREYREVWRTIKDIVFPLWHEIIQQANKDDYVFSRGLEPGISQIQPYQIGKRWYRLVKKQLGITADFYSLKHLHTTEIVDMLDEQAAAKHNEHTSTAMVVGIYDVQRDIRQHNKVKGLKNKFA